MRGVNRNAAGPIAALCILPLVACGGATPEPRGQDEADEDGDFGVVDLIGGIVGDVEADSSLLEQDVEQEDVYTGPTTLTVNLRVVDERAPEGGYTLKDAEGGVVIEGGRFGEARQVEQGEYTIEYRAPMVFGNPTHTVTGVTVAGPEQTIDEIFPAGRMTINTHRGATFKRCTPVPFTVVRMATEEPLEGQGKTCGPLYIEPGHYELRLQISKKKYQPVEIRVNREQMTEAPIQLEN